MEMTMSNILKKLRNYNKSNYNQFEFCITFAVLLMTAMMSIAQMPIVQLVFPVGGILKTIIPNTFSIYNRMCCIFTIRSIIIFKK